MKRVAGLMQVILVISLCFLNPEIKAQQCNIKLSGQILDLQHGDYLEFATVYIQETEKGIVSDSLGKFSINNLCPGNYHIIISHLGCQSKTFFISISQNLERKFYLEHHEELMDEIEISGESSGSKTGKIKTTLNKEMLFEQSGKSLTEMLTSIPGVSMLKSGPNVSKPIIQGMYGNRVTILNNGIPQEGQQWGNDHAPEIDPNTADKISVYKGASAIKYGLQALGGIVILEPDEIPEDPHWHGALQANFQSNGKMYGGMFSGKKSMGFGKVRLTAGYNKSGDKKAPDYFLTNTGNSDASFSAMISNHKSGKWSRLLYYSYYHNTNGILRGSHIGNVTDLQEAFTRKIPFYTDSLFSYEISVPKQVVNHHLIKYNTKYFIDNNSSLNLDAGIQVNRRAEFDIRRSNRKNNPALNLTLISQYFDFNYNKTSENLDFTTGIQYRNGNNTNLPGTGILPLIPDYFNNMAATYFIIKSKLKYFQLESGIRGEYRHYYVASIVNREIVRDRLHYLNWAANVGLKKDIGPKLKTVVDFSITSRPPEVNELFSNGLHQGVSGIELGNKSLEAEHSVKIVNEWQGYIAGKTNMTASLFYNRIYNFIYLQPQQEVRLTIRGAFPVFKYVGSDVALYGGDLKINQGLSSRLQMIGGLSYIYARNITHQTGLIRIPPLNMNVNLNYTLGNFWKIKEIKAYFGASYDAKQTNVDLSEDFLAPPDAAFLCNMGAKVRFKTKNGNDVDFLLRIDNLLNNSYRQYLDRLRYFADEAGRNIGSSLKINF